MALDWIVLILAIAICAYTGFLISALIRFPLINTAVPVSYTHLQKLIGLIGIEDPLRDESKYVIARLRQMGIPHIVMITGDGEKTAANVAARLGITEFYSQVLPDGKSAICLLYTSMVEWCQPSIQSATTKRLFHEPSVSAPPPVSYTHLQNQTEPQGTSEREPAADKFGSFL